MTSRAWVLQSGKTKDTFVLWFLYTHIWCHTCPGKNMYLRCMVKYERQHTVYQKIAQTELVDIQPIVSIPWIHTDVLHITFVQEEKSNNVEDFCAADSILYCFVSGIIYICLVTWICITVSDVHHKSPSAHCSITSTTVCEFKVCVSRFLNNYK